MRRAESAPARAGRARYLVLFATTWCAAASPLAAQAVAGLDKAAAKRETTELDVAVARLHDGWRQATLAVGGSAEPDIVVEAIVRMIHDPLKLVGLGKGALEQEENLALKAAVVRAEERLLAAPALQGVEGDIVPVRAETRAALDEYLAVLIPWLAARPRPATGASRP